MQNPSRTKKKSARRTDLATLELAFLEPTDGISTSPSDYGTYPKQNLDPVWTGRKWRNGEYVHYGFPRPVAHLNPRCRAYQVRIRLDCPLVLIRGPPRRMTLTASDKAWVSSTSLALPFLFLFCFSDRSGDERRLGRKSGVSAMQMARGCRDGSATWRGKYPTHTPSPTWTSTRLWSVLVTSGIIVGGAEGRGGAQRESRRLICVFNALPGARAVRDG
ncbi:hypothetical protein B0H16DRAFT_1530256 [Mycena metata]|uniref:Uncharacterized protein n=1 Tax=Mycena metata TaxID=1033252 RepID=A0AAD7JFJ5_9AGAR|nr:hypothetical protein B0H16DRAFT_1530256 [Mycena metata]